MNDDNLDLLWKRGELSQALSGLGEIWDSIKDMETVADLEGTLHLIARHVVQALRRDSEEAASAAWVLVGVGDPAADTFAAELEVQAGERPAVTEEQAKRYVTMTAQALARCQPVFLLGERGGPAGEAMACYPLLVAQRPLGLLGVYRYGRSSFTETELVILHYLANLAAMSIQHGRQVERVHRSLQRKLGELEQLRRADMLISSRVELAEMLQEILRIGLQMTGAEYGSFRLLDKRRGRLVLRAIAGQREKGPASVPELQGQELPADESSVVGWVTMHRRPLRISDLTLKPWCDIYHPLAVDRQMRSELAVPLLGAGGGVEGILNIESPAVDAFSEEDERLLQALATQAVIAIQEIKLLQAMQDIVEQLLTHSKEQLLQLIIDRACDLINTPVGAIWTLAEDAPEVLVLQKASGGHRRGDRLRVEDSLTGKAILKGKPITCPDVRQDPSFKYQDLARKQNWVSALIVPWLARGGTAIGAFSVYSTEFREFSDWDKRFLSCLANHAAIAIQDAEQLKWLKVAQERQAIAETFAAIGDIAANLLHQLNNKIGTIPARVQGIEEKCRVELDNPYLAANLREIEESAKAAMSIVRESMLHLQPVALKPIAVQSCVAAALRRMSRPANIEIIQEGLEALPPVVAGEQQLIVVFLNLIENAFEAMDQGGTLRISGRAQGEWVEIAVADSGPGIPPEFHERIFEMSFSVRRSGKRLGFGLWWVKMLLHRFGGSVEVESALGRGSTFTVRLPRAR